MSGNNRPIDTPTRRGYSGVKKIEIGSANKIKYAFHYLEDLTKLM
jgi:hypothetical protein